MDKVKIKYEQTDHNPNMDDFEGDHWKVTLTRSGKRFALFFSKGYFFKGEPPSVEEIIECLELDCSPSDNTFNGFCHETGLSPENPRSNDLYRSILEQERTYSEWKTKSGISIPSFNI